MTSVENSFHEPGLPGEHKIISIRFLTDSTFVLRFTRGGISFRPGQHVIAGLKGEMDQREYSIYSGEKDDFLEILVKEVKDGNISAKLRKCQPGDLLQVNGPFGSFGIQPYDLKPGKFIFIATGTGISPFHSIIRSYPEIDYTLIHGVRQCNEAYERDSYDNKRYILCTSKESGSDHSGRVTTYLQKFSAMPGMQYLLCGNGSMIYEAYHILRDKGVPAQNIYSERYF